MMAIGRTFSIRPEWTPRRLAATGKRYNIVVFGEKVSIKIDEQAPLRRNGTTSLPAGYGRKLLWRWGGLGIIFLLISCGQSAEKKNDGMMMLIRSGDGDPRGIAIKVELGRG